MSRCSPRSRRLRRKPDLQRVWRRVLVLKFSLIKFKFALYKARRDTLVGSFFALIFSLVPHPRSMMWFHAFPKGMNGRGCLWLLLIRLSSRRGSLEYSRENLSCEYVSAYCCIESNHCKPAIYTFSVL